jgi:glycosyltransferase involved in cell wall biosynthesis
MGNIKHKLLIISYDFAPEISGVRRVASFLRWLPKFGIQPTLLTTTPFSATGFDLAPLIEAEDNGIEIIRVPSSDLFHSRHRIEEYKLANEMKTWRKTHDVSTQHSASFREIKRAYVSSKLQRPLWQQKLSQLVTRWFFFPDNRSPWIDPASKVAIEWLNENPGADYLTTSFPHSCHLIGLKIKEKVFSDHRWVADFRDGWTQNADFYNPPTPWYRRWAINNETEVAKQANFITTASPPITDHLREVGGRSDESTKTLLNGYEVEEIKRSFGEANQWKRQTWWREDAFNLVYTGTLFGRRSAEKLLHGYAKFLESGDSAENPANLLLLSRLRSDDYNLIQSLNLAESTMVLGFQEHRLALAAQQAADALLLLIAPGPNANIMMTQKVFEYLATGLPILAIVPDGACRDLLQKHDQVTFADPENVDSIAAGFAEVAKKENQPRADASTEYTRENQAKQLSDLLLSSSVKK